MKIVIVGNSNCVFKYGFTKTISDYFTEHGDTVVNLSAGGSCAAYHIYTWHAHHNVLKTADIVILDSMIIDIYHHRKNLVSDEQIERYIHDMYALYSSLPGKLYSVFFPSLAYVDSYKNSHVWKTHKNYTEKFHVPTVDIYSEVSKKGADETLFMKDSHIHLQFANQIAASLSTHIHNERNNKRVSASSNLRHNPYTVATASSAVFNGLQSQITDSSFISHQTVTLDQSVSIGEYVGLNMIGVFQWNKSYKSKLKISSKQTNTVRRLRGLYSVFEVFNEYPKITEDTIMINGTTKDKLTLPPYSDDVENDKDAVPYIVGLLMCDDRPLHIRAAKQHRKDATLDLNPLIEGTFDDNPVSS